MSINPEIAKRRTFAIVSHPDAGKTTITEKFLWFGKVIREAGHVRAKANRSYTVSDWMKIEQDRGISVSSSVLNFPFEEKIYFTPSILHSFCNIPSFPQ